MKQFKRIMAFALALVLTLAMSITVFAEDPSSGEEEPSAKITVYNAEGAELSYVQIIAPDPTTKSGWAFVDGADAEQIFIAALSATDGQDAIDKLINGTGDIATALEKYESEKSDKYASMTTNPLTVTSAGVYAIKGVDNDYDYLPMAAYVSFKAYDKDSGLPTDLEDADVYAKKTDNQITKETTDEDHAIGISDTVGFTVTTVVPYGVTEWTLTDTITGASYVTNNNGQVEIAVSVGSKEKGTYYGTVTDNSFTVNLYDLISKETYGATVTLTYSATVTGLQVGNTIVSSNGGDTSNEVKLYTGSITITKKAEGSADAKLPGAGFKVYNTEKNKWATFDDNQLTGWVDNIGAATEVTTDTEGKVTVTGLNKGTYEFHEVTAPEGYSINATPTTVKLGEDISEEKPASAPFSEDGTMEDTQLKALPSTGGIGTTIFTVAGCLIMIAAAGMYFASRRRNAK